MQSIIYFSNAATDPVERSAMNLVNKIGSNPVSFYLSQLTKERLNDKPTQIDNVKKLDKLVVGGNPVERRRAAENPATNTQTLLHLSQDPDSDVRLSAAEHPKMPYFALKRFVQDPCLDVRLGLAENSNLPISILEMLIKDENPYIQDKARHSLDRSNVSKAKATVRAIC